MLKDGIYKSLILDESAQVIRHKSGLPVIICRREGAASAFAGMATNFGSVDVRFKADGDKDYTDVVDGTAHFLEHKLFEGEQGDAFELFAKTGANANAFTSFDRTVYYFTASQNFYPSLKILLEFVGAPYFTKENIAKEQGIIGQEIKMYLDLPSWRVMFNLLETLYQVNSVRRDIAGSTESIAQITPPMLNKIYDTFYNFNNMALLVAGDVEVDKVLAMCDECLGVKPAVHFERKVEKEPEGIVSDYVEQKLAVGMPMFMLGYKNPVFEGEENAINNAACSVAVDIISGSGSELYAQLYDAGLITAEYSCEFAYGRGFGVAMFSGESSQPREVEKRLRAAVAKLRKEGISDADFERVKAKFIGKMVSDYNAMPSVGLNACESYFAGLEPFAYAEAYFKLTKEQVEQALARGFDDKLCALSVILPNA